MKSWGEQQQFPTEVLNETEHLKAENHKLKERIAELESWVCAAHQKIDELETEIARFDGWTGN